MRNGLYKEYYNNGQLRYECYYINDILNGTFKYYNSTGQLRYECYYINDILNGTYKSYNSTTGLFNYYVYYKNQTKYYLEYKIKIFIINI